MMNLKTSITNNDLKNAVGSDRLLGLLLCRAMQETGESLDDTEPDDDLAEDDRRARYVANLKRAYGQYWWRYDGERDWDAEIGV